MLALRFCAILLFAMLIQYSSCMCTVAREYPHSHRQKPSRSAVAFGDSMTANGSFDTWFKSNSSKIDIASIHTYTANHTRRFCNGPVWVEYISALLDNADLYDFAQPAATINSTILKFWNVADLNKQVKLYLSSDVALLANDSFYHFMYMAGLDVNSTCLSPNLTNVEKNRRADELIANMGTEIMLLYTSGITHLMIIGVQPLQDQPGYNHINQTSKIELQEFTQSFNRKLQRLVEDIASTFGNGRDFNIAFFDMYKTYKDLLSPDLLAFNNNRTCNSQLTECAGFIWWDSFHPITSIQAQIAQRIYDYLLDLQWI